MLDPRLQAAVNCPFCERDAGVKRQQIIKGHSVAIGFYCDRCQHEWAMTPFLIPSEDRRQLPDRRQTPRVAARKG